MRDPQPGDVNGHQSSVAFSIMLPLIWLKAAGFCIIIGQTNR
jgi:hypothetical protein